MLHRVGLRVVKGRLAQNMTDIKVDVCWCRELGVTGDIGKVSEGKLPKSLEELHSRAPLQYNSIKIVLAL